MGAGWDALPRWLGAWAIRLVCVASVCATLRGWGQETLSGPEPGTQPYTLHVYQSLVQVPALVLTSTHEVYRGLGSNRFFVQLDGSAKFHPTLARPEGDDPITLALLLDASRGEQNDLLRALPEAMAGLQSSLSAHDHASVYAFDCALIRTVDDAPVLPSLLQPAVERALTSAALHGAEARSSHCAHPTHLWDAVANVTSALGRLPGRRVLVVLSEGSDRGSKRDEETVRLQATALGVTIFGLEPVQPAGPVLGQVLPGRLALETGMGSPLGLLCGGTGGMIVESAGRDLAPTLRRIIALVRGRYVLEFPRPRNQTAGQHAIVITTQEPSAVVRTGGFVVPVQEPAKDDGTLPQESGAAVGSGSQKASVPKP